MKFAACLSTLVLLVGVAVAASSTPFFGNKHWILLGQEKPGKHHNGITIKTEGGTVTLVDSKVGGCLKSWKFTNKGHLILAQDGSLDVKQKSFTVALWHHRSPGDTLKTSLEWKIGATTSPDTYFATTGMKIFSSGFWTLPKPVPDPLTGPTWVFIGMSLNYADKKLIGWIDEKMTDYPSWKVGTATTNGDLSINSYGGSSTGDVEYAGLTFMEGHVSTLDEIKSLKDNIIHTFCPPPPTTTTTTTTTDPNAPKEIPQPIPMGGSSGVCMHLARVTIILIVCAFL